jgi:hypothetical protein
MCCLTKALFYEATEWVCYQFSWGKDLVPLVNEMLGLIKKNTFKLEIASDQSPIVKYYL